MRSDTGPFALVPEWVLDLDLSSEALHLYALIGLYADKYGQAFPRRKVLAERLRRSVDTVDRLKKELIAAGVLAQEPRARVDGSRSSNLYTLVRMPSVTPGGRKSSATPPHECGSNELDPSNLSEGSKDPSANGHDSAQKTPLDLLWDACEEYVQKAPAARSQRAAYAKTVREMFEVGLTPEDVRRRARAYKRHRTFRECELTVAALAKWGEELDRGKRSLTEGAATNGAAHGDDGAGAPSVSDALPAAENLRRMQELRAMFNGQGALVGEVDPVASHGNGEASSTSARSQDARHGATKRRVPPAGEPSSA